VRRSTVGAALPFVTTSNVPCEHEPLPVLISPFHTPRTVSTRRPSPARAAAALAFGFFLSLATVGNLVLAVLDDPPGPSPGAVSR
jgi:hypothetical protein